MTTIYYMQGYEAALEKVGFCDEEILQKLSREKLPERQVPKVDPKSKVPTGGNAPKASPIPGAKQFGRLPGWGKGLAIGGAGLAAGAGLSHLLSNNSKE